jgi:hypothetical protein
VAAGSLATYKTYKRATTVTLRKVLSEPRRPILLALM